TYPFSICASEPYVKSSRSAYDTPINSACPFTSSRICRNIGYEQLSYRSIHTGPEFSNVMTWKRSALAPGNGLSSKASIKRNAAVHDPMPSASDRIAAADVTFAFLSCRQPKTRSARSESNHVSSHASRLSSRCRSVDPNALRTSPGSRPCAIASAMCASSSSSISRFNRSPRNTFAIRVQSDISRLPQNPVHSQSHRLPPRLFHPKLLLSRGRQLIQPRPSPRLFRNPLRADPSGFLHPVQRRIERTFLDAQHLAGDVLNRGHNRVPVQTRSPRKYLQYKQIHRALQG